jgi:uncharacterized membrane protein
MRYVIKAKQDVRYYGILSSVFLYAQPMIIWICSYQILYNFYTVFIDEIMLALDFDKFQFSNCRDMGLCS